MRQQPAAGGDRLEPAGAPATIDEEAFGPDRSDHGRAVGHHVHNPRPLPQQLQLREGGEHLQQPGDHGFLRRQIAALAMRRHAVEPAAEDQLPLVGLADIGSGAEIEQHRVEHRLHRLRHEGLQRIGLDRQPRTRHRRKAGRGTCGRQRNTRSARIVPVSVSTPVTRPPSISRSVTVQFSTMSTPRAEAARA